MKKVLLSSIIVITYINADIYIGVEQSLNYNIKNTAKTSYLKVSGSESPNITSIKIGNIINNRDGDRYEFLYNFGDKSANPVGGLKGKDVMSFNLNYNLTLPSITPKKELLPFFRFGLSYILSNDKYRVEGTYNDKTNYSAIGFLIGIGTYYRLNDKINLSVGLDYGYRQWEDLEYYSYYGSETIESSDKFNKLYIGIDYIF